MPGYSFILSVELCRPDDANGGTVFDDAFNVYGHALKTEFLALVTSALFLCASLWSDAACRSMHGLFSGFFVWL